MPPRSPSILDTFTREQFDELFKSLSFREREVIKLRFGLGDGTRYTLEEIGHVFRITRERVRTVIKKAERKASR
jgi:RNA polymerase primary sigma factor